MFFSAKYPFSYPMTTPIRIFFCAFSLFSTACLLPLTVEATELKQKGDVMQEAERSIANLEHFFRTSVKIKANFIQHSRINAGGIQREEKSEGYFLLEKPDHMKWEYQKPEREILLVSDHVLRYYTPEDNQLIIRKLDGIEESVGYLSILMDDNKHLLSSYKISGFHDLTDLQQVILKPISENDTENIETLELHIKKKNGELVGIIFEDSFGNRTAVSFSKLRRGEEVSIPPSAFQLEVARGTEIIDMDNNF